MSSNRLSRIDDDAAQSTISSDEKNVLEKCLELNEEKNKHLLGINDLFRDVLQQLTEKTIQFEQLEDENEKMRGCITTQALEYQTSREELKDMRKHDQKKTNMVNTLTEQLATKEKEIKELRRKLVEARYRPSPESGDSNPPKARLRQAWPAIPDPGDSEIEEPQYSSSVSDSTFYAGEKAINALVHKMREDISHFEGTLRTAIDIKHDELHFYRDNSFRASPKLFEETWDASTMHQFEDLIDFVRGWIEGMLLKSHRNIHLRQPGTLKDVERALRGLTWFSRRDRRRQESFIQLEEQMMEGQELDPAEFTQYHVTQEDSTPARTQNSYTSDGRAFIYEIPESEDESDADEQSGREMKAEEEESEISGVPSLADTTSYQPTNSNDSSLSGEASTVFPWEDKHVPTAKRKATDEGGFEKSTQPSPKRQALPKKGSRIDWASIVPGVRKPSRELALGSKRGTGDRLPRL